jgi:hypothetical protein
MAHVATMPGNPGNCSAQGSIERQIARVSSRAIEPANGGCTMKTQMTAIAALFALAVPAAAQMAPMTYDTDADGLINADEFNAGFTQSGNYSSYDANADGMLDQQEYDTAFTNREGMDEMMGERELGTFSDYDSNADGMLDEEEYNTAFFEQYDTDGSGDIDETERGLMDTDMQDGGLFGDMETDA